MTDNKVRQDFQKWYDTDLGQRLLTQEMALLQQLICNDVGYYFLIQSPLKLLNFPSSLLRTHMMLAPSLELGASKNTIIAKASELPIDSEAIDVHILHHTLELSDTPHDDLREAARTLLPSGKLIIIGFNPWSCWRIRQGFSSKKQAPWSAQFISENRLDDWLKVAGLTLLSTDYIHYAPPLSSAYWQNKFKPFEKMMSMSRLPLGGIYIITATKHTHSLISPKNRWKRASVRVSSLTKPVVKEIQK